MIISRAPMRLSLLGGGSDLQSYLNTGNTGCVIGGAINLYSYIYAKKILPFHAYKSRLVYSMIELVKDNKEISHRAIRETLQYLKFDEPIEIFHSSDIPAKSGTGSSSAFIVALLDNISRLQNAKLTKSELAGAAIEIEQNKMGDSVGKQDQIFAAFGGFNIIRFFKNNWEVTPCFLNNSTIRELEQHILLFYTNIPRSSDAVTRGYISSLGELDKKKDMLHLVYLAEQGREKIFSKKWEELGGLIDQSWRLKCKLPGVTNERINDLYCKARVYGAFGGKLMGAGAGGTFVFIVPIEKRSYIIKQLESEGLLHIPFEFESGGSQILWKGQYEYGKP